MSEFSNENIKNKLYDLILDSLVIGLEKGHISEEQFIQYMSEAEEIRDDSIENIRRLVMEKKCRGDPNG